jgi:hypothetical protein
MKRWKDNWDAVSPIFKIFNHCPEGHLYNQCDRITELHIPEQAKEGLRRQAGNRLLLTCP